jgi:hypothetical protein
VSGLVAVLSGDGAAPARGAVALSILHHDEDFTSVHLADDGVWLGACGRPHEVSIASDPDLARSTDRVARRAVAVVAGEVANAVALGRELGLPPQAAAAELALAAYRRWDAGLFERLEGIYALVVSEPARGATLAGTDAYGVMYLHVTRVGDDLLIATEAKAFLADRRFHPRLDRDSAACVVALGHEFGRGLFEGVEAAPMGCHFEIAGPDVRTVRHWDPRAAVGGLRGGAYVGRLAETALELAAEAFAGGPSLLPLTGGLDSRLLAAVRPPGAEIGAITFGGPGDSDCRRAGQIARACGMPHRIVPFEPDYVARHALGTTWLTEGRLTPVENTTGFQMRDLGEGHFVSGVCSGVGRRFSKSRTAFPDWSLTGPDAPAFDAWMMLRFSRSGMSSQEAESVFGARAEEVRGPGIDLLRRYIGETRGMCGVDRMDLYFLGGRARGWRCSGLDLDGVWITPRAPFFTRRWIEAALAGAPTERIDDLARIRLIRALDPAAAAVPWVMTLLPLGPSIPVLQALRQTSRLRRAAAPGGNAAPSARHTAMTRRYMKAAKGVYHRVYTYGDRREEWLRTASRGFVEEVLLSDRVGDHGFADPAGVRRLVAAHMEGADHTLALSILLGIELWQRLFEDGEWRRMGAAASAAAAPTDATRP